MRKPPSIAIIGAGPAGLTAARVLQINGIKATVFDAETSTEARDQGGTLDLHPDSGQKALSLAGLTDAFRAIARYEDQDTRLLDHATAQPLFTEVIPFGSGDRPEVDRKALRDMLLASLPPETVRWGHKLVAIEEETGSPYHGLTFANGRTEAFDLVIGADGAWSKVRAFLSEIAPRYTGVTFIECWLNEVDTSHPEIASLVGHGTMFAMHDSKGIIAQRNANAHLRVYAAFRQPLSWASEQGINLNQPAEVRNGLLSLFTDWSPQLLALIQQSQDIMVTRPIHTLPVDYRWDHRPGITLIGDAAHLMPPVGFGVNLAMLDAAELALALATANDWQVAARQQEIIMQARASALAPEAVEGFAGMYAPDAAENMLSHFEARRRNE